MCDPLEHCSNIVTCNEIGKFTKKIIAKLYRKSNKYVELWVCNSSRADWPILYVTPYNDCSHHMDI